MPRPESSDLPSPPPAVDARELARLSARERQALSLAADGYLDKQICALMGVTQNTLRTYWTRIRGKLGAASRGALIALYVGDEATSGALNPLDGASWHIDVRRNVLVFYGDRRLFPPGELDLDVALERYHPEDREGVRALLRAVVERDMPPFIFAARVVTDQGADTASAYVESVRDEAGRLVRIDGRHIPLVNLAAPNGTKVEVGAYRRDLRTDEVTVDEGFRAILRLRPDEPDVYKAMDERICEEYREAMRSLVPTMNSRNERSHVLTVRLCFGESEHRWISAQVRLMPEDDPLAVVATILAYD